MGHAAFCCFLHFAQRAFWAAAIRLRAAGEMARFGADALLAMETTFGLPWTRAHRARCAAAIRRRPAADMPRLVFPLPLTP
jgi:hypothetical protein